MLSNLYEMSNYAIINSMTILLCLHFSDSETLKSIYLSKFTFPISTKCQVLISSLYDSTELAAKQLKDIILLSKWANQTIFAENREKELVFLEHQTCGGATKVLYRLDLICLKSNYTPY